MLNFNFQSSSFNLMHPEYGSLPVFLYTPNLSDLLQKLSDSVQSIAKNIFDGIEYVISPIQKIVLVKHLIQIVTVPFKIVEIVKNCMTFSEKNREEKIDTILNTCDKVKEIGENSGAFVVALQKIKAVSFSTASLAKPFTFIISLLSIPSIISKYRSCMKVTQLMKSIKAAEEKTKVDGKITFESYQSILDIIEEKQAEDREFISDIFNTTEEKLKNVLVKIKLKVSRELSSNRSQQVERGQKRLENTVEALKTRIRKNFISHAVSATASTVGIIGTIILLNLASVTLGWLLLGFSTLVEIEQFVYHKASEYKFAQAVGLERTRWEWLTV